MDYKNGKIYQILNNVNDDIYVGSTCQALSKRFYEHRSRCKTSHNGKLYPVMREIGRDNFYIELIETYTCNNKDELKAREGYYIRERATLNMEIAGRSDKQYYEDNKYRFKVRVKEYNEEHKEHYKEYHKIRYQKNKEHMMEQITCVVCGCISSRGHMSRHTKTKKCINNKIII